jgi:hypothetical protein
MDHAGEFLLINLTARPTINAVQVSFADEGSTQLGRVAGVYYQSRIEVSDDDATWREHCRPPARQNRKRAHAR